MKRIATVLLLLSSFVSYVAHAAPTASTKVTTTPKMSTSTTTQMIKDGPASPNSNAAAYILIDVNSGKILAQQNMNAVRQPASLTKLMTLYLTFAAIENGTIKLDSNVLVSKKAWQTGGSKMFIKVNTHVTVEDLIRGIIVDSGNDAAIQLAQYVGGSVDSFVTMMNAQAKRLGMTNTHFSDPTGLPEPGHVTSAYDLSLLARAIVRNFPKEYPYFSEKWFSYNGIRQPNRNRLLWRYTGTDGLKTGHTAAAGYCLIASAKKNDQRLLSVVLGAPSDEARSSDSIALLRYGFRFYQSAKIYSANDAINHLRVWGGANKEVPVGVSKDFYLTTTHHQFNQAMVTITTNSNISAPIQQGQQLGNISIKINGKMIETVPLVALQANPKGGIFRRFFDAITHKLSSWFHKDKHEPVTIPITSLINVQQTDTASTSSNDSKT